MNDEEDFKRCLLTSQPEPFPFFPGNIKLTRWIRALYNKGGIVGTLVGIVFRYPSLMFGGSILNLMGCYHLTHPFVAMSDRSFVVLWTFRVLTLLLFSGLMIEVMHLVLYRYVYGALDNILNGEYVGGAKIQAYQVPLPQYVALRRLMSIFIVTFIVIVISYGSIYFALYSDLAPHNSFQVAKQEVVQNGKTVQLPITKDLSPVWVQMLYFSTTTLCTVGFGDIYPLGWLCKLLVMTQMSMGFTLLVLLLTAFVASLDPSESFNRSG